MMGVIKCINPLRIVVVNHALGRYFQGNNDLIFVLGLGDADYAGVHLNEGAERGQ